MAAATAANSTCPPWLHAALADIEQRVRSLATEPTAESEPDSFAERAEYYYQKRPQLISLLRDLYHSYRYLADRYSHSIIKPHPIGDRDELAGDSRDSSLSSDADSTISCLSPPATAAGADVAVAGLVGALVDRDLVLHALSEVERRGSEAARKAELQGSLLEVLESERLVLLGENARLGVAAAAAEDDARELASELGYVRRRATELARCLVNLSEGHRACLLDRRIECLQAQVLALERRNRECYEAMVRREAEKVVAKVEVDRLRAENRKLKDASGTTVAAAAVVDRRGRCDVVWRWWDQFTRMEWALCAAGEKIVHVKAKRKNKSGCMCQ